MATKTSNRQCIYPKHVIYKAVYLLSAEVYHINSNKFKIVHLGSTNAKHNEIFGPKFILPWQLKL